RKVDNVATNTALPSGYRELGSVSAAANVTGGLPNGFRRVVAPNGDVSILGPSGKVYTPSNRVDVNGNAVYTNGNQNYVIGNSSTQQISGSSTFSTNPLWTSTSKLDSVGNASGHWTKHGAEFPEYSNATQYVQGAQGFLRNPPAGTLTSTRANGDVVRYNPSTNTFGVMTSDGTPRTMFRPSPSQHGYPSNLDYFYAQ
ncbi:hypothetical protein, partial [Ruegeria sp. ANG-R]|uniref:hypothetical protein n=1 Tax=Ruegeria sp. ANG-R TaxID=1577903 RepID=UPI0019D36A2A